MKRLCLRNWAERGRDIFFISTPSTRSRNSAASAAAARRLDTKMDERHEQIVGTSVGFGAV